MSERAENGQFTKGHSGNRNGKPTGARNKATLAALDLLGGETEALSRKAIEMALDGDTTALRLCLERIAPPSKERPLEGFELPPLGSPQNILAALELVAQQLACGDLLPSEAKALCLVLDKYHDHYETTLLAQRIEILETKIDTKK